MAIKKTVRKWIRICPVRFERAVASIYPHQSQLPVRFSPDIDDRGFAADGAGLAGPALSVMLAPYFPSIGDFNKVKLVRQDIDDGAPLLAMSNNDAIVKVKSPAAKFQGSRTQDIELEAVSEGSARIRILYDGDLNLVLGELSVRVVEIATGGEILVRPYLVTIAESTGANPRGPAARNMNTLFDKVNNIWRPHGIQFRVLATRHKNLNLTVSGTLRSDTSDPAWTDWYAAFRGRDTANNPPDAHAINILFVHVYESALGATEAPPAAGGARQATDSYGIVIGDPVASWPDDMVIAHELGHYFQLNHTDENLYKKNWSDMWNLRCLMTNHYPDTHPPWHNNVGYGPGCAGALIPIRNLNKWDQDGQHRIARDAANVRCY